MQHRVVGDEAEGVCVQPAPVDEVLHVTRVPLLRPGHQRHHKQRVAHCKNQESGVGSRESGIGNRESGIGNRESGIGNRECFIGDHFILH